MSSNKLARQIAPLMLNATLSEIAEFLRDLPSYESVATFEGWLRSHMPQLQIVVPAEVLRAAKATAAGYNTTFSKIQTIMWIREWRGCDLVDAKQLFDAAWENGTDLVMYEGPAETAKRYANEYTSDVLYRRQQGGSPNEIPFELRNV